MPKAASPVRLQEELMQDATLTGKRFHRSAAEQVEYWASIGRRVADILDPDTMLNISAGLARIEVEPVYGQPVDPNAVFANLEREREQGTLSESVTRSAVKYQGSTSHPGYLEQIDIHNNVTVGQFENGKFTPLSELAV